jgi:hypothetical protein
LQRKPGLRWGPTGFVFGSIDREDDYGEEVKGKEEIREEEGGSGAQEEKDDKDGRQEINQEGGKEGRAEEGRTEEGRGAQGAAEEARAGRPSARSRTGNPGLVPAPDRYRSGW